MTGKKTITIFYHYFHPDPVISARLYTDIACSLCDAGWDVSVYTSNKLRHESNVEALKEDIEGIRIHRLWHPPLPQRSFLGRMCNTFSLLCLWSWVLLTAPCKEGVLLFGTDPPMSHVLAFLAKLRSRKVRVAHWCFDLYPELLTAEGMLSSKNPLYGVLRWFSGLGYKNCDLLVDIGPCMRERLALYDFKGIQRTIVPFALVEAEEVPPLAVHERERLFENAALAILYSGSFGRGHKTECLEKLVTEAASEDIRFSFSVPDHHKEKVHFGGDVDSYVSVVSFAKESELQDRLTAADVHIVTLKPGWTGMVIPSKFFGSMSMGRPVLFFGSKESSIARWIKEFSLGWIVETTDDIPAVLNAMHAVKSDPVQLRAYQRRAYEYYQSHCKKEMALTHWEQVLEEVLVTNNKGESSVH